MKLTRKEKIELGTKKIAKKIRKQLKKEFKNCKFSVRMKRYSGGSSITIALMEAPFQVYRKFEELSDWTISDYTRDRTKEQLKQMTEERYSQLNHYTLMEGYDKEKWNNGAFITKKAHNMLQRAVKIANRYNFDDSDIQTDYFHVNFYLHMRIGKYNKPFKRT